MAQPRVWLERVLGKATSPVQKLITALCRLHHISLRQAGGLASSDLSQLLSAMACNSRYT